MLVSAVRENVTNGEGKSSNRGRRKRRQRKEVTKISREAILRSNKRRVWKVAFMYDTNIKQA